MRRAGVRTGSKVSKMNRMAIAVVNTKLFINKKLDIESWHCTALTQAVTCYPVAT